MTEENTTPERRVRPAAPDDRGVIRAEGYEGPDRRAHRERQKARVWREKMKILNRTTLSVSLLAVAVLYAASLLLAPEIKRMNDNAARIRAMEAQMEDMHRQIAAAREKQPHGTVGATISREIGAATDAAGEALTAVKDTAAALAPVVAPAAGVEDLLQLLSGVQTLGRTRGGIAALGAAVEKLRAAVAVAAPADVATAIDMARRQDATLGALLNPVAPDRLAAAALLLAFDDMRRRIARQEPFGDDLALIAALTAQDPATAAVLNRLEPYAAAGIAGRDFLQRRLSALSADIVAADMNPGADDGALKTLALKKLSRFITVRKAADIEGSGPDAVVARAQRALDAGDVRAALTGLSTLQGPAALAAAPWVALAAGYVAADDTMAILSQTILQTLTTAAAGGGFSLQGLVTTLQSNLNLPSADSADVPYVSAIARQKGQSLGNAPQITPYQ